MTTVADEDLFIASHDSFESCLQSASTWGSTVVADDNEEVSVCSQSVYTEVSEAYDPITYQSFRDSCTISRKVSEEEEEEEEYDHEGTLMKAMDWANDVPAALCQPFETACAPFADLGATQMQVQKDMQYSLLMNSSASPQTSNFFNPYSNSKYSSRLLKSARREDTRKYLSKICNRISLRKDDDLINVGQKTLMSKAVRRKNPKWNSKVVKQIRTSNKIPVGPLRGSEGQKSIGELDEDREGEEGSSQYSPRKENVEKRDTTPTGQSDNGATKVRKEKGVIDHYQSRANERETLLDMLDRLLDEEQITMFNQRPRASSLKRSSSNSKKCKSGSEKKKSKKKTKKVRIIG
mmetsp:Transcript_27555/g.38766  ORF Transcript_27555/g.38766 Transcript_27555/m.38766 type:complete len:350 (+) Transcript_27555:156-1205(+)